MLNYFDPGTLHLDDTRCTGCSLCTIVCPHAVFVLNGTRAEARHPERCMECGACALNCPSRAITAGRGMGCAAGILSGGCCGETGCC
jgi:NAD-dependent dihydropyrimidine dehydrogenase PreA subunit